MSTAADHANQPASQPASQTASPEARAAAESMRKLVDAVGSVVVGQHAMVERLLIGMLTGGHVLLEGVPGLAKTLTVSALAGAIRGHFSRIQFTPDLLPADLVGTLIFNPSESTFTTRKGPVFANIVLADEINRAPAKVQSALLEAMQEKSVTIGDETHRLPRPFLVLATQNPIEQEGTYPLPEAQVDRFMLKLSVGYPSKAEEREIVKRMASTKPNTTVEPAVGLDDILAARDMVDAVFVDDKIHQYAVDLVGMTREPGTLTGPPTEGNRKGTELARLIEFGASPRASINLVLAARAHAFLQGRDFVSPSDIKSIAVDVMRHRVIISYEAEAERVSSDDIVRAVLDHCPVP